MTKRLSVLLLLVCLLQGVSTAQGQRTVTMSVHLENGATPIVRVADGQLATLEIPGVGAFGFVPKVQANGGTVTVDIYAIGSPDRKLDSIVAVVGRASVSSNSKPVFEIAVPDVTERK